MILDELTKMDSSIISDQEGAFIAPILRGVTPKSSILTIMFGLPNLQHEHYEMIKVLYSLFPDVHMYCVKDCIKTVSYTHLDVYKRQELIKTNLKSLKLEDNSASMITNTISDLHITGENNVKSNTNADDGSVTVDKDSNVAIGSDGTYIQLNTLNGSSTLIHGVVATASGSKLLHQLKYVPIYHFQRTCEYIESQREVDDRFKVIYV